MDISAVRHRMVSLGAVSCVAVLFGVGTGGLVAQDLSMPATYGTKTLNAGFLPDPFLVRVDAGGPIKTDRGGVTAWVAKAPDFRLTYKAGAPPLTIYAECAA